MADSLGVDSLEVGVVAIWGSGGGGGSSVEVGVAAIQRWEKQQVWRWEWQQVWRWWE